MPPYDYSGILSAFGGNGNGGYNLASAGQGVGALDLPASGSSYPWLTGNFNGQQGSFDGLRLGNVNQSTSASTGGIGGWLSRDGNLSSLFGGIQALGGAYLGFQQMAQAKNALNFQKQAYKTNLANSVKTYNNSLEDRINGRTSNYAGKDKDVQSYLDSHKLKG